MDEVEFTYLVYNNYEDEYYPEYNYPTLFNFAQAFVDTIRNSGGIIKERLLIITGHNADFYATCSSDFQVPNDPANKLAISIHYLFPYIFTIEPINNLFSDNDYYMSLIK